MHSCSLISTKPFLYQNNYSCSNWLRAMQSFICHLLNYLKKSKHWCFFHLLAGDQICLNCCLNVQVLYLSRFVELWLYLQILRLFRICLYFSHEAFRAELGVKLSQYLLLHFFHFNNVSKFHVQNINSKNKVMFGR